MKKPGLRLVLTFLVVTAVAATALFIHLLWNFTARRNIEDMVRQLNRQIVEAVHRDFFAANYNIAWSTQEALRAVLADRRLAGNEDSVLSLMNALLLSEPGLSWIGYAATDGGFLALHRRGDGRLQRVSVAWPAKATDGQAEIAAWPPGEGPTAGIDRRPTTFRAVNEPWFKAADEADDMVAMESPPPPGGEKRTLCFAAPVKEGGRLLGVVAVMIDFDRLSQFLDGLPVGMTGTVLVLSKDGGVVAAAAEAMDRSRKSMPELADLAQNNRLLGVLYRRLATGNPSLGSITDPREISVDEADGRYFINISSLSFQNWVVATVIPGSDFLSGIDRKSTMLLAALLVLTLVMAFVAVTLADRLIAAPLLKITGQLKHIERFDLGAVRLVRAPLRELGDLSQALLQMSAGLASFQKYMPTSLVRTLVSQGIEARPGGHKQDLTVLFADVVGFSGLSETLGDGVVPLLTDYLDLASGAILATEGTIDKFIGDGVMAFWGAPLPNARHAALACAAALDLQRRLARQRAERASNGLPVLAARIGINSGLMLVGNIGSHERLNYTIIGDAVNVGSRLESLNKVYGTEILIGEDCRKSAGEAILVRRLDHVAVYGRAQGLMVYELLAMADEMPDGPPDWVAAYEAGLQSYAGRDWEEAIARFERAGFLRGRDRPSEIFIERSRRHLADPPPADWTPLSVLDTK